MAVKAYLDRCDADLLGGWAIDDARPGHPVEVEILFAGEVVGSTVADGYRPDLAAANIGDGRCAFHVPVSKLAPPTRPERLAVRVKGSEVYVSAYERNRALPDPLQAVFQVLPPPGFTRRPLCLLHIGFEKTGSTSIQRLLQRRRAELTERGYFVPLSLASEEAEDVINHVGLASIAVDETNFQEDFRTQFGITDTTSIHQHRLHLIRRFVEEISTTKADSVVVLSNEHCQSRLDSFREIARLKTLLMRLFEEVHILAFIRPQHEVAVGLYDSSLRRGTFGKSIIPDYSDPRAAGSFLVSEDYFDYCRTLDRWACVFGRSSTRPALYKTSRSGPGILPDFLSLIGISGMTLDDVPRENRGFHPQAQAVLALFNESLHRRGIAVSQQLRDRICNALIAVQASRSTSRLGPEAKVFLERFAASNEDLRQTWFPACEALFRVESYSDSDGTKPTLDGLNDVVVDLLRHFVAA